MSKATLEKEILIETPNKVGIAGELTHIISDQGRSNIRALWGGVIDGKGSFAIIAEDNKKILNLLQGSIFTNVHEEDVVVVKVPNQIGACADVAGKLGQAGIDINWLYTTIFDDETAVVVSTKNNKEAVKVLA